MEKVFILSVDCQFDDEREFDIIEVYKNKEDAIFAHKEQVLAEKENSFLSDYFDKNGKLIPNREFDDLVERDGSFFFADKAGNFIAVYITEKELIDYNEFDEWFNSSDIDRLLKITGYKQEDFSIKDNFKPLIIACRNWWDSRTIAEKRDIYKTFNK